MAHGETRTQQESIFPGQEQASRMWVAVGPSALRAPVRPLVKVLLPYVTAVQHEDIKDVDRTYLPLGLPLEGQGHCPPRQALAWGPLRPRWPAGLHST